VNFLFAFELISFVSRPDTSQIAFQNRARLLVTKTVFNPFLSASRQHSRLIYPKAPINSSAELAIFSNLDQGSIYRRCFETSLVISNILTWLLPLNTGLSESSALKAFVVCADEKLTAFLELEAATRDCDKLS
jgi:hypothetical protein